MGIYFIIKDYIGLFIFGLINFINTDLWMKALQLGNVNHLALMN